MSKTLFGLGFLLLASSAGAEDTTRKTENVLLITFDGLRWEEVFNGADEALLNKERGGVSDVAEIKKRFWRNTPEERRKALLPFLWNVVAKEGQIFGNPHKECPIRVLNKRYFSYPGYNELLTGFPDDRIDSNNKNENPNVTVLEWLHNRPGYRNRIAAVTSWELFPWIINTKRSGIPVLAGYAEIEGVSDSKELSLLSRLALETPLFGETTRNDALTYRTAMAYLKEKKPRVLFVSFDETDTQGHAGRYDRVLASAYKNDQFVRGFWEQLQSMPEYRGKTSLVIATDHGRGPPPVEWKNHGAKVPGAEFIWTAVLGPDTPAMGERSKLSKLSQGQVAASVAALLSEDYAAAQPKSAKPFPGITAEKSNSDAPK